MATLPEREEEEEDIDLHEESEEERRERLRREEEEKAIRERAPDMPLPEHLDLGRFGGPEEKKAEEKKVDAEDLRAMEEMFGDIEEKKETLEEKEAREAKEREIRNREIDNEFELEVERARLKRAAELRALSASKPLKLGTVSSLAEQLAQNKAKREIEEIKRKRLEEIANLGKSEEEKKGKEETSLLVSELLRAKMKLPSGPVSSAMVPASSHIPVVSSISSASSTTPPTMPLLTSSESEEEKKIGEYKNLYKDEEEMKKHYDKLDETTQNFLDAFFKPDERQRIGFYLGSDQLSKLNDPDFLANVLSEINDDIEDHNKSALPGDEILPLSLKDVKYGLSDVHNQKELAYAIRLYDKTFKSPEKLNFIFSYDPAHSSVLKKSEIMALTSKANMQERDPEKIILRYIDNIKYNTPQYNAGVFNFENLDDLDEERRANIEQFKKGGINEDELNERTDILDNIYHRAKHIANLRDQIQQIEAYKTARDNGDIDQKEFDNKIQNAYEHLITTYNKDPAFTDTLKHIQVRTVKDVNQFNNYIRQIDTIISSNPTNIISLELKKILDQVKQEIVDGKLDLHEAYKKLSTFEPVKHAINAKPDQVIQMESETKEIEEEQPDLNVIKDFNKKARSKHLVALDGVELKGFDSIIKDEAVYDLNGAELNTLYNNFNKVLLKFNFSNMDFSKKKVISDAEVIEYMNNFVDELDDIGISLDPSIIDIVKDIQKEGVSPYKIRKDAYKFQQQLLHIYKEFKAQKDYVDKEENKTVEALNIIKDKIEKDYKTAIEDEKDTTKQQEIIQERDEKIYKLQQKEREKAKKKHEERIEKALEKLGPISSKSPFPSIKIVSKNVSKLVTKPKAKVPKIIIPASLAKERAEEIKKSAEAAVYAKKTSSHEKEGKRSTYGEHVLEFKPRTDDELLKMKQEIQPLKGQLYIVDLPTGRLHPMRIDKIFVGATYIFQKDLSDSLIKGGAIHGASAYFPTLSKILRDDEQLNPYIFMQNGNDKLPAFYHKLGNPANFHLTRNKADYRDQMRNEIGGSIWSHIKRGLKEVGNDTKNYLVNTTVNAAKDLAKQSVGEAKNFVQQEKRNINYIGNANKQLYKNPSFSNLNRAINRTVYGSTKLVTQPAFTTARELANVSDFAGKVPGLNVAKYGLEYALPPLAVADSLVHATRDLGLGSQDKAKYLDATINGLDAMLGTGKLSGKLETGTKALNLGLKVADVFADRGNHPDGRNLNNLSDIGGQLISAY